MLDPTKNFATTQVDTAPSPATSGTTLTVNTGTGILFPDPATDGEYNLTVWEVDKAPTVANAEIVRVTAKSGDTLTIERAQEGSSVRTIVAGDSIALTLTSKTIDDIDTERRNISSGLVTIPTYTDNLDGTVTIGSYWVRLFPTGDYNGDLNLYFVAGDTFTLTDDDTNYIVCDYNSGSPDTAKTLVVGDITTSDVIPIYTIYRNGTDLTRLDWNETGLGLANQLFFKNVKLRRFEIESGLKIDVTTTYMTCEAGMVWNGITRSSLLALDTTPAESNGEAILAYHSAGVWTYTDHPTFNNTQYDDGTNLQTLSNNHYAVNWIFRSIDTDQQRLFIVLGGGDYTLAEAEGSEVPELPQRIIDTAVFVGRIIVEKSAVIPTAIEQVQKLTFSYSQASDHENLLNLQGGAASEYYHLDYADYINVSSVAGSIVGTTDTQTLTNKTIDGDNNTILDLATSSLKTRSGSGTHVVTTNITSPGSHLVYIDGNGNIVETSIPYADALSTTNTKTITNKTIDADNNVISNLEHGAEVDNPSSGVHGVTGSVVGTTDTQTLTNKTLGSGSKMGADLDAQTYSILNAYIPSPVINTAISGTAVLDEDDMASDSNTKIATQQSIKAYVDNTGAGDSGGWIPITQTINVGTDADGLDVIQIQNVDLTGSIGVGMRVKVTQNSTVYYGIIHAIEYSGVITSTLLSVFLSVSSGTRNRLDGTTITNLYYSREKSPVGFPTDIDSWTLRVNNTTEYAETTFSSSYFNFGSISLDIPLGCWKISHSSFILVRTPDTNKNVYLNWGLGTTTSSIDYLYRRKQRPRNTHNYNNGEAGETVTVEDDFELPSSQTLYFVINKATGDGWTSLRLWGSVSTTYIKAINNYF